MSNLATKAPERRADATAPIVRPGRHRRAWSLLVAIAAVGVGLVAAVIVDRDSGPDDQVQAVDARSQSSTRAEEPTYSFPYFEAAPGWESAATGTGSTAASITLGPMTKEGNVPWDTVERLDEDGDVVVFVMFWPARDTYTGVTEQQLPLTIDDAVHSGLEGQPDHIYTERLAAQVNGWNLDVLVFYGGTDRIEESPSLTPPSPGARTAAQEQLARLVVPHEPSTVP